MHTHKALAQVVCCMQHQASMAHNLIDTMLNNQYSEHSDIYTLYTDMYPTGLIEMVTPKPTNERVKPPKINAEIRFFPCYASLNFAF